MKATFPHGLLLEALNMDAELAAIHSASDEARTIIFVTGPPSETDNFFK